MPQQPLADRIRPQTLDQFIGQTHLVGQGKPIRQMIENGYIHSMILWGPPGVGKTTLARLIARQTGQRFSALSAVSASKDDLRKLVQSTRDTATPMERMLRQQSENEPYQSTIILFLDEIHRFNKAQQDFLLPYVEDGTITLIGATTENPSFEVISALLSRTQVFVLEPLSIEELQEIIRRGGQEIGVSITNEAVQFLANYANGDGRAALNLLNNVMNLYGSQHATISIEQLRTTLQSKHLRYDRQSEEHYNTISAYIKSMRASDVDAALYYLARMVAAGEDPKFIARRIVIFASEDIGLADPQALVLANAVFRAVETIGYPEAQINLAHGTTYMALAPKSRATYDAFFTALNDVSKYGNLPIPLSLRNAPTELMRNLGYGQGHDVYTDTSLLPDAIQHTVYFRKSDE